MRPQHGLDAMGVLHRGTLLLACTLVAIKASYLGPPPTIWSEIPPYARALAATSSFDVLFAMVLWAAGVAAVLGTTCRPRLTHLVVAAFLATAAVAALYAVASVVMFGIFGGFLTYSLLTRVNDVRMLRSSVALHLTPAVAAGLVLLPLGYVAAVLVSGRLGFPRSPAIRAHRATLALLVVGSPPDSTPTRASGPRGRTAALPKTRIGCWRRRSSGRRAGRTW